MRNEPPKSLSIHAQCFWVFTPTERNVIQCALDDYMGSLDKQSRGYRVASILFDALMELSTQD